MAEVTRATQAGLVVLGSGEPEVRATQAGLVVVTAPAPLPADAAQSTATVPAFGMAGAATNVTVQAKDALGNNVTTGGDTVVVVVGGFNVAGPVVTDVGDGTYTCSYTPNWAGPDTVAITLNGTSISGSAYATTVIPAALAPGASTATVPAGTVGLPTAIVIQEMDAWGNQVVIGGGSAMCSISGANTAVPVMVDNGDGTYSGAYTPANAGTDSMILTIDGTPILGSPYTSVVAAAGGGAGTAGRRLSMGLGLGL